MSKMEEVKLQVTGMTCPHCEKRVVTALERIPGVKQAKASAKENTVAVSYDIDKTGVELIRETILDCGYTPT